MNRTTAIPLIIIALSSVLIGLFVVTVLASPAGAEWLASIPEDSLIYRLGLCH